MMTYLHQLRFLTTVFTGEVSRRFKNLNSDDTHEAKDEGLGTLELVLLAIGLAAVAAILVEGIRRAVTSKTTDLENDVK